MCLHPQPQKGLCSKVLCGHKVFNELHWVSSSAWLLHCLCFRKGIFSGPRCDHLWDTSMILFIGKRLWFLGLFSACDNWASEKREIREVIQIYILWVSNIYLSKWLEKTNAFAAEWKLQILEWEIKKPCMVGIWKNPFIYVLYNCTYSIKQWKYNITCS